MTISSETNRVSYTGNGVTVAFSFPYYFLADEDLVVISRNISSGAETVKAITTDYTVTGALSSGGGTVTMLSAPTSAVKLSIYRDPAVTQALDLVDNDPLPAEPVERAFDRGTMIAQRLNDRIDRAVRLTDGFASSFDPQLPALLTADSVLQINSAGTGLSIGPTASAISGAQAAATSAAASAVTATSAASTATTQAGIATSAAAAAQAAVGGVKVSSADTTAGHLDTKITVTAPITKAITSPAGDERLSLTHANTAVTPAAYTNANITVDAMGHITAAANGTAGKFIQGKYTQSGAVATGTTTTPVDDTIPQNTEGDEYLTLAITPTSASSILVIEFDGEVSHSVLNATAVVALHQDSAANALAAKTTILPVVNGQFGISLRHQMVAGTTSATTFKVRIGGGTAGTLTLNGAGGSRQMGGAMASSLRITEYTP